MIRYAVVDKASGEIFRTGTCPDGDFKLQAKEGEIVLRASAEVSDDLHYYKDGIFKRKPEASGNEKNDEALRQLRRYRQPLLDASDWTELPRAKLSPEKRAEWEAYRDELKDLPQQYPDITSIDQVVFPAEPG